MPYERLEPPAYENQKKVGVGLRLLESAVAQLDLIQALWEGMDQVDGRSRTREWSRSAVAEQLCLDALADLMTVAGGPPADITDPAQKQAWLERKLYEYRSQRAKHKKK